MACLGNMCINTLHKGDNDDDDNNNNNKVILTLEQATKARRYSSALSLTSALVGMGGQRHAPAG
jgi:hypothetical protein